MNDLDKMQGTWNLVSAMEDGNGLPEDEVKQTTIVIQGNAFRFPGLAEDATSSVSHGRLAQTCSRCHANVNASFTKYDPHPNPRDYRRSPVLWWVYRFYTVLIAGCFSFFGLHSVLWFRRSRQERRHP